MRIELSIIFGLLAGGCMANDSLGSSAVSEKNVNNLSRIAVGMSQGDVLRVMKRPHNEESFQLKGDSYEVWFYVTTPTALGQKRMATANLTPLTFKNGFLVAIGNDYYKWLVKQEKLAAQPTMPTQTETNDEDTGLEKALAPTSQPAEQQPKKGSNLKAQQRNNPNAPASPTIQPQQKNNPNTPNQPIKSPPPKATSMCSRPQSAANTPLEESDGDSEEQKKEGLDREDKDFLDEESEQNFNFW